MILELSLWILGRMISDGSGNFTESYMPRVVVAPLASEHGPT